MMEERLNTMEESSTRTDDPEYVNMTARKTNRFFDVFFCIVKEGGAI